MATPEVFDSFRLEAGRCGHLVEGMTEAQKSPMRLVQIEHVPATLETHHPPLILLSYQCQTCGQVYVEATTWAVEVPQQLPS